MSHGVENVDDGSLNRAYLLCMAGLVHDIGKVGQRANDHLEGLGEATKSPGYQTHYLPSSDNHFTHFHVLYTGEFLHKSKISFDSHWKYAEGIALGHHNPSTLDEHILARADHLSSASDRLPSEEYEARYREFRFTSLTSVLSELRLIGNQLTESDVSRLPLRKGIEELDQDNLTIKVYTCSQAEYSLLWDGICAEFKKLDCNVEPDAMLEKASALVDLYGWSVPSATNAFPDINLADHSKGTAIIASALRVYYDSLSEEDKLKGFDELFGSSNQFNSCELGAPLGVIEDANADKALFRLVIGDLAGIQNFITDIQTNGASRNMKARSFLVDCWADRIAALVLREFGMPEVCKVYATGGKFLLIVPNSEDSTARIRNITASVNSDIARISDGLCNLSLRLASTPLSQYDLKSKGFGAKLHHLLETELPKASQHPQLDDDSLLELFNSAEPKSADIKASDRTDDRSSFDSQLVELGKQLAGMKQLLVFDSYPEGMNFSNNSIKVPGAQEWIAVSGSDHSRKDTNGLKLSLSFNHLDEKCDGIRWYAGANSPRWHDKPVKEAWRKPLEDIKQIIKSDINNQNNLWLNLYAKVPDLEKEGSGDLPAGLITFSSLDDAAQIATGFGRIGILRMDVDNLGWLMAKGLDNLANSKLITQTNETPDRVYSLGRMMSLSSLLVKFFSGILPKILDSYEVKDGKGNVLTDGYGNKVHASDLVFIIYAGGDDAFLVGPWFIMPDLAIQIRKCFQSWVGESNLDVGLSAGIKLVSGKYPISVGAVEAGECEEAAKNLTRATKAEKKEVKKSLKENPVRKDRLDFMEFTASWNEWDIIKELSCELETLLSNLGDRGFLRLLGKVAIAYREGIGSDESKTGWLSVKRDGKQIYSLESLRAGFFPGRWRPLLHYSVSKYSGKENDPNSKQSIARRFADIFTCGEVENVKWREKLSKFGCNREPIEYLATVVRWTDYLGRKR